MFRIVGLSVLTVIVAFAITAAYLISHPSTLQVHTPDGNTRIVQENGSLSSPIDL